MSIKKLLDLKNDYVFKRIFGFIGNEKITKKFLQAIIPDKINKIELDANPITEKDLLDDKVGILDIKAKLNDGNVNCDIEMQVATQENIAERMLFYWSKMYSNSIKSGMNYEKLEKCIVILISDYNLEKLNEIKEFQTKWNLREEKYSKLVLTDVLEIYIIELEKAKKLAQNSNTTINEWFQFINNPKAVLGMESDGIKKAKKVLEEISEDERERRLTELREKYIMDQQAIHDHGYDKGWESGIEEGSKQEKIKIAKRLKEKGIDVNIIAEVAGLTKEEIEKL